jgi:hypothetical protein
MTFSSGTQARMAGPPAVPNHESGDPPRPERRRRRDGQAEYLLVVGALGHQGEQNEQRPEGRQLSLRRPKVAAVRIRR